MIITATTWIAVSQGILLVKSYYNKGGTQTEYDSMLFLFLILLSWVKTIEVLCVLYFHPTTVVHSLVISSILISILLVAQGIIYSLGYKHNYSCIAIAQSIVLLLAILMRF